MKKDAEKLKSIELNVDPRKGTGYKNYFYIGAPQELRDLGVQEPLMADFSQTTCISGREFPAAMALKILQLDDRTRMKFKLKLGFFYAKPLDEEVAVGIHEDPWKDDVAKSDSVEAANVGESTKPE